MSGELDDLSEDSDEVFGAGVTPEGDRWVMRRWHRAGMVTVAFSRYGGFHVEDTGA